MVSGRNTDRRFHRYSQKNRLAILNMALTCSYPNQDLPDYDRRMSNTEIEHPMALVILGGLVSSMLLNLLVMPILYWKFGKVKKEKI